MSNENGKKEAADRAARTLTGTVVSNKMDKTISVAVLWARPSLTVKVKGSNWVAGECGV